MVLALGWPLVLAAVVVAFVHIRLGPRAVLQSLAVVVIIKFLNDAIYDFPPMFGLLAWALLLASAIRVFGLMSRQALPVLLPLWFFVLVVAALTPFASASPTVTWFKLASFLLGATTDHRCVVCVERRQRSLPAILVAECCAGRRIGFGSDVSHFRGFLIASRQIFFRAC